jgi:cyclopropane fatty-acyl-phospholipid synthase-like methyltransferase
MVFGFPSVPGIDIFEIVLWMVEFMPVLMSMIVLFTSIAWLSGARKRVLVAMLLFFPVLWAVLTVGVWLGSHEDAVARGYDMNLPSMREKLETFVENGEGDLNDILNSDKYAPTFGKHEMNYLIKDLFTHTILHLDTHNEGNIDEGYNKGNDWFEATLGEPMVYTSGIYPKGTEDLKTGQEHKLDFVANAIELKKGDTVLDIGCGWGRLLKHFTEKYGAKAMGITLSSDQRAYGLNLNKNNDVGKNEQIHLQDAMKMYTRTDLVPKGGFDKITSLEMAEHVGIRRYQEFLTSVHNLLADDGVFYFQVAGLRRQWRYEDLVWGLFMGEHVFPGADASCPLGWVSTQLERAGFEIQRVHNLGTHYSRTLDQWLQTWRSKKASLIKKYGEKPYRRWEVFLAWSVRVARQGSSTVFMFALTKQGQEARRIKSQHTIAPQKGSY